MSRWMPAAAVLLGLGFGLNAEPQRIPGGPLRGGSMSLTNSRSELGRPSIAGVFQLCLTAPGSAVIEGIHPRRVLGSLAVDRFAIEPNPRRDTWTGASDLALPGSRRPVAGVIISQTCAPGGTPAMLAVQLTRTAPGHAALDGIIVDYRIGSKRYRLVDEVRVALCDPENPEADDDGLNQKCSAASE